MYDKNKLHRSQGRAFVSEVDGPARKRYMGVERRRTNRRVARDRRASVRFDLKGGERRENFGRRDGDKQPRFW